MKYAETDAHLQDDKLTEYIRTLLRSRTPAQVTETLQHALRSHGYPRARVRLLPHPPCPEPELTSPCWHFPLAAGEQELLIEIPELERHEDMPPVIETYVNLARDALQRVLDEQEDKQRLFNLLEHVGASMYPEEILNTLVRLLLDTYNVESVAIFRYLEEPPALRVEAVGHRDKEGPLAQPGHVFHRTMCPTFADVLEHGRPTLFVRGGSPDLTAWEWNVFFTPTETHVLVLPFWLSTRDLGLVSIGGGEDVAHLAAEDVRLMLQYTTLALERAQIFAEALRRRAEVETLLRHTLAGILLVGPDWVVKRANEAAAHLWQTTPQALVGRPISELLGESFLNMQSRFTDPQCRTDQPLEWTVEVDEREFTLLLTISSLNGDETSGYLISFLDITERERLKRLKEQMFANVTHELRTPIAVIRGYAELLMSQLPSDAPPLWPEALRIIEQRADDLLDMVEMYLDLAQLEANGHTVYREYVSVPTVVGELVTRLMERLRHALDVKVNIAKEAHRAWVDAHLFEQIVRHLLENAMKFTPAGGHVWIRAWAEGQDLHLEVEDTGMGIPAEELGLIFDRFYRASNVEYGIPGSGLGLTLVEEAVRAHGGTIEVSSEEGKGTVIHVVLPGAVRPD